MWFMFVIPFITFFIIFFSMVTSFFKAHKKTSETIEKTIPTILLGVEYTGKEAKEEKPEQIECEYCGEVALHEDTKCRACGARLKRKKETKME